MHPQFESISRLIEEPQEALNLKNSYYFILMKIYKSEK